MCKMIFWNIRSVNTQQAFERLTNRNGRYYYKHIGLMKPFGNLSNIDDGTPQTLEKVNMG